MNQNANRNIHVDKLRAIAALGVVTVHFFQTYSNNEFISKYYPIAEIGKHGVPVFFALSGYLLTNRNSINQSIRVFAVKRFLRIYPAYFICLAILCAITKPSFVQILTHIFLVHMIFGVTFGAINYPFWSLSVETFYYVFIPLLNRMVARKIFYIYTFLTMLSFIWQLIGGYFRTYHGFDSNVDWVSRLYPLTGASAFLIGVLYKRNGIPKGLMSKGKLVIYPLIASEVFSSIFVSFSEENLPTEIIQTMFHGSVGYFSYGLCAVLYLQNVDTKRMKKGTLSRVGVMSYSLYLWHLPMLQVYADETNRNIALFPGVIIAILFVTYLSYIIVEKPFISMSYKMTNT